MRIVDLTAMFNGSLAKMIPGDQGKGLGEEPATGRRPFPRALPTGLIS